MLCQILPFQCHLRIIEDAHVKESVVCYNNLGDSVKDTEHIADGDNIGLVKDSGHIIAEGLYLQEPSAILHDA